jgi:hypothetical protein
LLLLLLLQRRRRRRRRRRQSNKISSVALQQPRFHNTSASKLLHTRNASECQILRVDTKFFVAKAPRHNKQPNPKTHTTNKQSNNQPTQTHTHNKQSIKQTTQIHTHTHTHTQHYHHHHPNYCITFTTKLWQKNFGVRFLYTYFSSFSLSLSLSLSLFWVDFCQSSFFSSTKERGTIFGLLL